MSKYSRSTRDIVQAMETIVSKLKTGFFVSITEDEIEMALNSKGWSEILAGEKPGFLRAVELKTEIEKIKILLKKIRIG